MKKPTDQQFRTWAERIRQSDQQAFDELFRSFYPVLVCFAMRYVGDKTSGKDIVQDCFVSLWQTRQRLDASRSLKSYLYMMVRNRALNALRDRSEVDLDHELVSDQPAEPIAESGSDMNFQNQSEESALQRSVKMWIDALPDRQKEAFSLSRFEGLDHEEIAQVMDVSPKTVNNHIVAALQSLREKYEAFDHQD